jgi:hypothetical protein
MMAVCITVWDTFYGFDNISVKKDRIFTDFTNSDLLNHGLCFAFAEVSPFP